MTGFRLLETSEIQCLPSRPGRFRGSANLIKTGVLGGPHPSGHRCVASHRSQICCIPSVTDMLHPIGHRYVASQRSQMCCIPAVTDVLHPSGHRYVASQRSQMCCIPAVTDMLHPSDHRYVASQRSQMCCMELRNHIRLVQKLGMLRDSFSCKYSSRGALAFQSMQFVSQIFRI